jgi:hypothetical protein
MRKVFGRLESLEPSGVTVMDEVWGQGMTRR